jgi:hypothetical protein
MLVYSAVFIGVFVVSNAFVITLLTLATFILLTMASQPLTPCIRSNIHLVEKQRPKPSVSRRPQQRFDVDDSDSTDDESFVFLILRLGGIVAQILNFFLIFSPLNFSRPTSSVHHFFSSVGVL